MPEHRIFLAGTKFGHNHYIKGTVPEGTALELRREPANPYDANAISVWVPVAALAAAGIAVDAAAVPQNDALKLGMMPASRGPNWARLLSGLIDGGKAVTATFRRGQDNGQVRVVVASEHLPETVA